MSTLSFQPMIKGLAIAPSEQFLWIAVYSYFSIVACLNANSGSFQSGSSL